MKNRKIAQIGTVLFLLVVFSLAFTPSVKAAAITIESYTTGGGGMEEVIYSTIPTQRGMTFNVTTTAHLTSIDVQLKKGHGSPTGFVSAKIYNASAAGTYGTDKTYGTLIAYSNLYINVESLNVTYDWVNFTFSDNENIILYAGTYYTFLVYLSDDATGDSSNDIHISATATNSGTYSGNSVWYYKNVGTWYTDNNDEYYFIIEGDSDLDPHATATPATPGPLPTGGSYDTSDIDGVINTLAGYMIPLVLFLLPAILLGYMTKWAMWPILIGLAIGAGLTYLFLGTQYVWLVFLVACGIGGAIYKGRGTD